LPHQIGQPRPKPIMKGCLAHVCLIGAPVPTVPTSADPKA
jgi:hypothetical protein